MKFSIIACRYLMNANECQWEMGVPHLRARACMLFRPSDASVSKLTQRIPCRKRSPAGCVCVWKRGCV